MTFTGSFYRSAQRRFPEVLFQGDTRWRALALTFDDGPHLQDTPRLLDVLEKHRVRATFHVVGKSAGRHPDLIQEIHQCGHQLALHCYRHIPFPLERPEILCAELDHTRRIIAESTGISLTSIRDLRPPYGLFTARTLSQLMGWGYRLVMWSCLPPHWMQPIGWSIHQVMKAAVPGAVIVLHDGHGHGAKVAEIVDAVIPGIKSLGLEFITVQEMWSQRNMVVPKKLSSG